MHLYPPKGQMSAQLSFDLHGVHINAWLVSGRLPDQAGGALSQTPCLPTSSAAACVRSLRRSSRAEYCFRSCCRTLMAATDCSGSCTRDRPGLGFRL